MDPLASLKPREAETEVLGQTWVIPAMSAADWLRILWAEPFDPWAIFPGLCDAHEDVVSALLDGTITEKDVFEIAMEFVGVAAGMDWWFAINLTMLARAAWASIGGTVISSGIWSDTFSLSAWLSVVLTACLEKIAPDKLESFIKELNTPPPGFERIQDEFAEGDAFLAAMRQL